MTESVALRRAGAFGIAAFVFAADQGLKAWLLGALQLQQVGLVRLMPFFDLRYSENEGVSLGLLTPATREGELLILVLTAAITVGVAIWILRERAWGEMIALGLVLGGAVGNFNDRRTFGCVIDYADLHFGQFRPFMIFNLADVAITFGVLLLLARALLMRDKPAPDLLGKSAGELSAPATET